ncbi:MAG TPA: Holliday junction branch migration protein RuvA [Burkholderiales bacterium]|nr:Holliday junction branch migration protein RuvA [Burkholderiales bacterium]
MIGRIHGKLIEKHPPQIIVDVQGIGYEVDVPMSTFYQLPATGADISLYTHLAVRADAHQLYGFATEAERHAFRQLLKISGVGARTALAVLSGLSVGDLREAVVNQDCGRLTKIPGIGKKTSERLLLELRDKLDAVLVAPAAAKDDAQAGDVANALLALGYSEREASWAIKQLPQDLAVADGIRQALRLLSKQ